MDGDILEKEKQTMIEKFKQRNVFNDFARMRKYSFFDARNRIKR